MMAINRCMRSQNQQKKKKSPVCINELTLLVSDIVQKRETEKKTV